MTFESTRNLVAAIVVIGHFLVFMAACLLYIFGPLSGGELANVLLMASPVLAVTAASAVRSIMDADDARVGRRRKASRTFVLFSCLIPTCFTAAILVGFWACYVGSGGVGPEQLTIYLGTLEVAFGAYIGAISDRIFGLRPR